MKAGLFLSISCHFLSADWSGTHTAISSAELSDFCWLHLLCTLLTDVGLLAFVTLLFVLASQWLVPDLLVPGPRSDAEWSFEDDEFPAHLFSIETVGFSDTGKSWLVSRVESAIATIWIHQYLTRIVSVYAAHLYTCNIELSVTFKMERWCWLNGSELCRWLISDGVPTWRGAWWTRFG